MSNQKSNKKNKIVYVVADGFSEYNSSHFRCSLFYNELIKHDWDMSIIMIDDWLGNTPKCQSECNSADIIIIQRVLIAESLQIALQYKQNGKKIFVDFDDAYHLIGEENAAYPFWGKGKVNAKSPLAYQKIDLRVTDPVYQFGQALKQINGGITPSGLLSKYWSRYNKMYVLQNYLDWNRYDKWYRKVEPSKKKNNPPVVGWGGSMSHLTSFVASGVVEALQKMTQYNYGKFLLVGDKRVQPLLGINEKDMLFHPYVMWMDWIKVVFLFDIGLAPLAMEYDQHRSRLKVMEYIALGIPFVATKSVVYEDFFDCESGAFIDQGEQSICDKPNSDGWFKAIKKITNDYDSWKKTAVSERDRYKPIIDIEQANLDNFFKGLL